MIEQGATGVYYETWTAVLAPAGNPVNIVLENTSRYQMIWKVLPTASGTPSTTDWVGYRLPRRSATLYNKMIARTIYVTSGETLWVRVTSPHFDASNPPMIERFVDVLDTVQIPAGVGSKLVLSGGEASTVLADADVNIAASSAAKIRLRGGGAADVETTNLRAGAGAKLELSGGAASTLTLNVGITAGAGSTLRLKSGGASIVTTGVPNDITLSVTVLDETSADLTAGNITQVTGAIYFVVLTAGASAPSALQIYNGTDSLGNAADWAGGKSVLDTNDHTVEAIQLTQGVSYRAYAVHRLEAGVYGNVVTSDAFTPADVTAPVLSAVEATPGADYTVYDQATVMLNTDTSDGVLYTVITRSGTAPTAAQVIAGQTHTGAAAPWSGSQPVTGHGPQTVSVAGLLGATEYWAYSVHVDGAGNASLVGELQSSFTTKSATIIAQWFHEGNAAGVSLANSTITENYPDPDGGNNAILQSSNGTSTSIRIEEWLTYADGVNRITVHAKSVTTSTGTRWFRGRPMNVNSPDIIHWDVITGSVGNKSGLITTYSSVDLGGGWWRFSWDVDMTGDADRSGNLTIYPSHLNNNDGIPAGPAGAEEIAWYNVTVELIP